MQFPVSGTYQLESPAIVPCASVIQRSLSTVVESATLHSVVDLASRAVGVGADEFGSPFIT